MSAILTAAEFEEYCGLLAFAVDHYAGSAVDVKRLCLIHDRLVIDELSEFGFDEYELLSGSLGTALCGVDPVRGARFLLLHARLMDERPMPLNARQRSATGVAQEHL